MFALYKLLVIQKNLLLRTKNAFFVVAGDVTVEAVEKIIIALCLLFVGFVPLRRPNDLVNQEKLKFWHPRSSLPPASCLHYFSLISTLIKENKRKYKCLFLTCHVKETKSLFSPLKLIAFLSAGLHY